MRVHLGGMRGQDAEVFAEAAKWFGVYILVRATNPSSLEFIDKKGYSAKRFECKAKTADFDVVINGTVYKTAGLVVDPNIVGHGAYKGGKHEKAVKAWSDFWAFPAQGIYDAEGKPTVTYYPGGGTYGVQMDPAHPHYGCVMFSSNSLISAATYIHGDYDLYAIVNAKSPLDEVVFARDEWAAGDHFRSKELLDVQTFVNRRLGRPMVLHGDQEKFSPHTEDEAYVFFPDGRPVATLKNKSEIEKFYRVTFPGRPTGGEGAKVREIAGTSWLRVHD